VEFSGFAAGLSGRRLGLGGVQLCGSSSCPSGKRA